MAILRKNRLSSPATSPDRDTNGQSRAFRALFTTSPTSLKAITPIVVSPPPILTSLAGNSKFNPKLIFSQIVAIQSLHYLILSFLFQISYVLSGSYITIDRIFTNKYIQLWTKEGWIDNITILLSCFINAMLLALIVEKSKKCLDFSITLFTVHFVICTMYNGFPSSWDWWIVHILGMIIMVLFGEYLCSRVELRDIPLL